MLYINVIISDACSCSEKLLKTVTINLCTRTSFKKNRISITKPKYLDFYIKVLLYIYLFFKIKNPIYCIEL